MAVYRVSDLSNIAVYADDARAKLKSFRRHINGDNTNHGTDKCEYCNEFAKDLGLLPDPVLDNA